MKIATDITETVNSKNKINELSKSLQVELDNSNKLRLAIEIEKDAAVNDLDATIKKSQNELIKTIVKSALFVIMSVGFITTIMYSFAILSNKDTQIIGSTWSNMFSVLLTNAFSIVGTIMGIKYATSEDKKSKEKDKEVVESRGNNVYVMDSESTTDIQDLTKLFETIKNTNEI